MEMGRREWGRTTPGSRSHILYRTCSVVRFFSTLTRSALWRSDSPNHRRALDRDGSKRRYDTVFSLGWNDFWWLARVSQEELIDGAGTAIRIPSHQVYVIIFKIRRRKHLPFQKCPFEIRHLLCQPIHNSIGILLGDSLVPLSIRGGNLFPHKHLLSHCHYPGAPGVESTGSICTVYVTSDLACKY